MYCLLIYRTIFELRPHSYSGTSALTGSMRQFFDYGSVYILFPYIRNFRSTFIYV
nr:MAG TPA: hypothetical protein [Caudoviricetes sp.]